MKKYDFPALCISPQSISFNQYASKIVPDKIEWFSTPDLFIGLPANSHSSTAYKTSVAKDGFPNKVTAFPEMMKAMKVERGYYKVYKCRDGFAFKRYKPLRADGVEPA